MSDYTIAFEKGTPVWKLYQKLKQEGIKDKDLDRGYLETDYVKKERRTIGEDDHKIQKQEVLDYALERSGRFQLDVQETTGYVVPWSLDDLDPATVFDEEIRTKTNKAIAFFKDELKKAGYQEGTDRYQELLALSLYAFALAPADGKFPEMEIPTDERLELEKLGLKEVLFYAENQGRILELENAGLEGVYSYLKERGGLGLMEIEEDCELEASALDALKSKCGRCTEASTILYAIFKLAGLKANFIYGMGMPDPAFIAMLQMKPGEHHVSVALILEQKTRIFDLSLKQSDAGPTYEAHFAWWFTQTNREFLAAHYSNLGVAYAKKGELDLAIETHKKAIQINPNFAEAYYNLGVAYAKKGELDLAIETHKKAIQINPNFAEAYCNLGVAYAEKGELDLAIEAHKKAIEINPNLAEAYGNLGFVFAKKGDLNQAVRRFTEFFKLPPISSVNVVIDMLTNRLKEKWQSNDALKKTAAAFDEESGGRIEIAGIEAFFVVSSSLWLAGKHEQARERLEIIVSVLDFKKKPSQATKEFFKKMIGLLPGEMKTDAETRTLLNALKEKLGLELKKSRTDTLSYRPYEGREKKPLLEFDLGMAFGAGFYNFKPLHLKRWEEVFNPGLGVNLNISERVKTGYHISYATSWLGSADSAGSDYTLHSLNHELGLSYDVLHSWPDKTRSGAVELNLGGGLLLKNNFLAGAGNTSSSFNTGGFVSAKIGLVGGWGHWPYSIPLWTKVFLKSTASKGKDVDDFTLLLGFEGTFELY